VNKPNPQHSSATAEWYTPADVIARVRNTLGTIHIDPCSSLLANKAIKANAFFSAEENGLDYFWAGNAYINPPSSCDGAVCERRCTCKLPFRFMEQMFEQFYEGNLDNAIYLGFNIGQLKYLSKCYYNPDDVRFVIPHRRIRFVRPDGTPGKSPTQENFIMLLTNDLLIRTRFDEEFSEYGTMFGALS